MSVIERVAAVCGSDEIPKRSEGPLPGTYMLAHPASGLVYVGSTNDLYRRRAQHNHDLKKGTHPCKQIQEAYNQEPTIAFSCKRTTDREAAFQLEQNLLDECVGEVGFANISPDAKVPTKGVMKSDAHKEMNRQAHLGKSLSDEHRAAISAGIKETGVKWSKPVEINGVQYASIKEAARLTGTPRTSLKRKLGIITSQ